MLADLYARSYEDYTNESDTLVLAHDITFTTNGGIDVPSTLFSGGTTYSLTDWALQQTCNKLGPPPKRYIDQCPGWLQANNLNYWRDQLPSDRQWLIRAYGGNCRAVLSDSYSSLHNHQILQWLQEYGADGYPLIRPYLDPDTMHLKVMITSKDAGRGLGEYGFGAYVGNGEIGNRAIRVLPFVQRTSCTNSIIFNEGLVLVHRFRTPKMVEAEVKQAIGDSLRVATDKIEAIWQAAIDEMPKLSDVVTRLCKEKGLNEEIQHNILIGTEGYRTRMGLANGLSWAAHQQDNHELMIDMETWAGAVIASPDSLFGLVNRQLQEAELES